MTVPLAREPRNMYSVHMKNVTPSQARKNWFRLLDEAVAGEEIMIERNGHRLVLRKEEAPQTAVPSYQGLIRAHRGDEADTWGWEWTPEGLLSSKQRPLGQQGGDP
jgi:hypothetical protein